MNVNMAAMKVKVILTMALICAATNAALAESAFITSYWYGPPPKFTSIEHYRQIKEANFNVVFPPGPPDTSITREQNLQILDFCKQLEMKAVIFDPRMPKSLAAADARANIDAIIADYSAHPALLAYFVVDEPSAGDFPALGEVVAYIKQRDPKHPAYINLFPMHAAPWAQLGTETYDEYVARYLKLIDPFVLSYDHYPFTKHGDNPNYFTNLAIIRNAAVASRRPFWNIAQLVQHYDYRPLTEPELRFQAMQTLAFGAGGLLWYTYWYPGQPNPTVAHAMIDFDGKPAAEYEWIKSINADARAIGDELIGSQSWATFHAGEAGHWAMPLASPIAAVDESAKLAIGVFRGKDRTLALVTNRDYRKAVEAGVRIKPPDAAVERFDPATRTWSPAKLDAEGRLRFSIPAGDGVLLRWPGGL